MTKENLTRVQITQRNRERNKVLNEELKLCGITAKRLFIDDRLYCSMEQVTKRYNVNIHDLMFVAMRDFLAKENEEDYSGFTFNLELAMALAHAKMVEKNLGGLRDYTPQTNKGKGNQR